MAEKRESPYIWVTWLSRLLSGESNCKWSSWFRAHFHYDKRPSNFDFAEWNLKHAEMVRDRASSLREEGYRVFIEEQNRFAMKGRAATVGGKPDIIAEKGEEVLIVDCKTGERRDADYFQMLIYLLIVPYTRTDYRYRDIRGELQYKDGVVKIGVEKLTDEMKRIIRKMIEEIAGENAPPRVPSAGECRFCDISISDCSERVDEEKPLIEEEHDLF